MSKTLLRGLILLTALVLGPVGCGDDSGAVPPGPGPGPGPAPGGMGAEPVGANPTIRQIMGKLTKGPGSLTAVIGKASRRMLPLGYDRAASSGMRQAGCFDERKQPAQRKQGIVDETDIGIRIGLGSPQQGCPGQGSRCRPRGPWRPDRLVHGMPSGTPPRPRNGRTAHGRTTHGRTAGWRPARRVSQGCGLLLVTECPGGQDHGR